MPVLNTTTAGAVAVGAGLGFTPVGKASVKEKVIAPAASSSNGVGEAAVVPAMTVGDGDAVSGAVGVTARPLSAST